MRHKNWSIVILVLIISLLLTSCSPGQSFGPTITPSPIATNTPLPTPTITSTPMPTATITPNPTATFPICQMSNPAFNVIDLIITVEGDQVTATFYLKDVPTEMEFQRKGIPKNTLEYEWSVYFDVDNNMNTGSNCPMAGSEYYLHAVNVVDPLHNQMQGSLPIEKGIMQVMLFGLDKNGTNGVNEAIIKVDPEANTISLSGNIPGITSNSKIYFKTYDYNPGGEEEEQIFQVVDRVVFN